MWDTCTSHYGQKKFRNGDTLGPVELNVWLEPGNQGDQGDQGDRREQDDQGEVSIIIFGMSESSGFQKYSISWVFQALFFPKTAEYFNEVQSTNILWRCSGQLSTLFNDGRGGVLIKICSKAVRSHLHFWWSWWWWWQWWQWWRTLSHIDAQKPIYGIKCLWEFGCTPWQ